MDFSSPPRRPRTESIVPMINVVFLLLIFFLMTAQIAPPEPFQVMLPSAEREDPAEGEVTLYVSAEGLIGFLDFENDAAISEAVAIAGNEALMVRADAGVNASTVAALLRELAQAGAKDVTLVTMSP